TLGFVTPTGGGKAINLPDEAGTLCIQTSTNCGFAPASGSANYIQNQSGANQSADFRITGSGRANTSLLTPLLDVPAAGTLSLGTNTATGINLDQNTTVTGTRTFTVAGLASGAVYSNSGVLSSEAQLAVTRGGTGLGSYTTGDLLYASAGTTLAGL